MSAKLQATFPFQVPSSHDPSAGWVDTDGILISSQQLKM